MRILIGYDDSDFARAALGDLPRAGLPADAEVLVLAAVGLDPVRLRLKNISAFSQAREGNPAYTTTGFKECLEQGAAAFD